MDKKKNGAPPLLLSTTARGQEAEGRAVQYLETQGYEILARNLRWKGGEGDVFCLNPQGDLVLVEVRSAHGASPWLRWSVGPTKVRRLIKTLHTFRRANPRWARRPHHVELLWVEGQAIEHWRQPFSLTR